MKSETWKSLDFLGYPCYKISNMGRVKSYHREKERILVGGYDTDGYKQVILCEKGTRITKKIYHLVALAFVPNPNNYNEIHHIDENKLNDDSGNLIWGKSEDRYTRETSIELRNKSRLHRAKNMDKLGCYTLDGKLIKEFKSVPIARRELGVSSASIHQCCKGKVGTCCGMVMRLFKDEVPNTIKVGYFPVRGEAISKKVAQYDKSGMFICVWDSAEKASSVLNISSSHITSNCTGYRNSKICHEYMFRYVENDVIPKKIEPYKEKSQKIGQYDKNGKFIKSWNNAQEVADYFKISPSNIRRNCAGKVKITVGFMWEYIK